MIFHDILPKEVFVMEDEALADLLGRRKNMNARPHVMASVMPGCWKRPCTAPGRVIMTM
jgi:hypothetical protein